MRTTQGRNYIDTPIFLGELSSTYKRKANYFEYIQNNPFLYRTKYKTSTVFKDTLGEVLKKSPLRFFIQFFTSLLFFDILPPIN